MGDIGKITEIEPEDGLGWIELENGDRVRFGGTSCKGFVPAVGMTVDVVATRPGFRGTVKATELRRVADAPKAAFAVEAGAGAGAAAAPEPRTSLHTVQASGVRADDVLLSVLGRADVDDRLHADLVAAGFHVQPAPGLELGCKNPWFYAVAKDASGNLYGMYAHPMFEAQPWLMWNTAAGALRWIAEDASMVLQRVLATAAAAGVDGALVARLRANLVKLGMPDVQGAALAGGVAAEWLPPDDADLRPLDDYLAETDGGEMERGLLAHAFGRGDARANEALRGIYDGWQWSLPAWAG